MISSFIKKNIDSVRSSSSSRLCVRFFPLKLLGDLLMLFQNLSWVIDSLYLSYVSLFYERWINYRRGEFSGIRVICVLRSVVGCLNRVWSEISERDETRQWINIEGILLERCLSVTNKETNSETAGAQGACWESISRREYGCCSYKYCLHLVNLGPIWNIFFII